MLKDSFLEPRVTSNQEAQIIGIQRDNEEAIRRTIIKPTMDYPIQVLPQEPSTVVIKQVRLENPTVDPSYKFLNYGGIDDVEKLSDLLDPSWITKQEPFLESSDIILGLTLESIPTLQPKQLSTNHNLKIYHQEKLVWTIIDWTSSNHPSWLGVPIC